MRSHGVCHSSVRLRQALIHKHGETTHSEDCLRRSAGATVKLPNSRKREMWMAAFTLTCISRL